MTCQPSRATHPFRRVAIIPPADKDPRGHETGTLEALGRRIADLMGVEYAGRCDDGCNADGATYIVPATTLVQPRAEHLGIHDADGLFGGVVPWPFVATKLVSHPALGRYSPVPEGWNHALSGRLGDSVLPGFSVFDRAHALLAFDELSRLGRTRFKLARGIGGSGQHLVDDRRTLEQVVDALPPDELNLHGASLEQDLREAVTFSIGTASCAGIEIAYTGTQRTTRGPHDHEVYAGSDLDVARGGLDALVEATDAATDPEDPGQALLLQALRQVQRYDREMLRAFPGLFASRRNYDVVAGLDADGRRRSGVLEQSWRIGGASPAELLAMEAFARDPQLERIRTACFEVYGAFEPPQGAVVHFRGEDPRLGRMTKYAMHVDGAPTPAMASSWTQDATTPRVDGHAA